jgi:undecaprenyl-diphosphatase
MDLHLILVSIIEGITEFLPISSTAHIILLSKIFDLDTTADFLKFFILFIQFGALAAGIILFSKKLLTDRKVFFAVCVSFIPSAVIGFALYKIFKKLLEGNLLVMAIALIIGGLIFIYLEKIFIEQKAGNIGQEFGKGEISIKDALVIGIAQATAIVPGVSRSGASIIAGIFLGVKKAVIIEYTFLLAIPTVGAAVLYDAYKSRELFSSLTSYSTLIWGFAIAGLVAYVTLQVLRKYLPRLSLTAFGWYRIVLGLVILITLIY